jgi:hypothetical protein
MESNFTKEFLWVVSVLNSCTNDHHIQSTKRLFDNLLSKHTNTISFEDQDYLHHEMIKEEFQRSLDKKTQSLFF